MNSANPWHSQHNLSCLRRYSGRGMKSVVAEPFLRDRADGNVVFVLAFQRPCSDRIGDAWGEHISAIDSTCCFARLIWKVTPRYRLLFLSW